MLDRRRYCRLNSEIPISFRPPDYADRCTATMIDFSALGFGFRTGEKLLRGQTLAFSLTLPSGEATIFGDIVRVEKKDVDLIGISAAQPYRIGVKLVEPVKFDEMALVKFYATKFLESFKKQNKK